MLDSYFIMLDSYVKLLANIMLKLNLMSGLCLEDS